MKHTTHRAGVLSILGLAALATAAAGCSSSDGPLAMLSDDDGPVISSTFCGFDPSGDWEITFTPAGNACGIVTETIRSRVQLMGDSRLLVTEEDDLGCETNEYVCSEGKVVVQDTDTIAINANCTMESRWDAEYRFLSDSQVEGDAIQAFRFVGSGCPAEVSDCTASLRIEAWRGGPGPACAR